MSENHKDEFDRVGFIIVLACMTALMLVAYFEIDSRIQLSQLKDLQRRVGELEQKQ